MYKYLFLGMMMSRFICDVVADESKIINLPTEIIYADNHTQNGPISFQTSYGDALTAYSFDGSPLRVRPLLTVEDVVKNCSGVIVSQQFTGTSQVRFIVRGFGISGTPPVRGMRLLQDGMPMTLPDGMFLPQNIDYRLIGDVGVYRAASNLSKSLGSLGGAIDFETIIDADSNSRIRAEVGSFQTMKGHLLLNERWQSVGFTVSATHSVQKGYRKQNHENADFLNASFGWKGEVSQCRFFFNYSDVEGELSGPLSIAQSFNDPRSVSMSQPHIERDKPFRDILVGRAGFHFQQNKVDTSMGIRTWILFSDYEVFRPVANEGLEFRTIAPGTKWDYGYTYQGDRATHSLYVCVEAFVESRPTQRLRLERGMRGALMSDHDMLAGMVAATIEDQISFGDLWSAAITLQPQIHWREVDEVSNQAKVKPINFFQQTRDLCWRLQGSRKLTESTQIWTAVSYQMEPPILTDLVGAYAKKVNGGGKRLMGAIHNDLEDQRLWTYELGFRLNSECLLFDIDYYYSHCENEVIRTRPPSGPDVTINSSSQIIHQGFEVLLSYTLLESDESSPFGLNLQSTFSYNHHAFDDDSDFGNSVLPCVPEFFFDVELNAKFSRGFFASVECSSTPNGMFVDYANTLKTEGYTLLGFRVGKNLNNGWKIFGSVSNALDTNYVASVAPQSGLNHSVNVNTPAVFPGQGRRWYTGVEYEF